jgi:hypothetical protein
MRRFFLCIFTFIYLFVLSPNRILACDSCGCALSRIGTETKKASESSLWFVDFTFEQQNWDEIPAQEAHELHHDGHHVHDKTHEEFYHFGIGSHPTERITVFLEIPYIIREQIKIHEHETLGQKEQSDGFGDLKLTGIYRLFSHDNSFLGPVAGVKFPTGETGEKTDDGETFEPELQPGSGSFDYIAGAAFRYDMERFSIRGNSLYIFRTEGDQDFEFGDLWTSYVFANYLVNPGNSKFKIRPGIDFNLQVETKQEDAGEDIEDSGGTTLLIGPALMVDMNEHVSFVGNILFPAYQDLGGLHQELEYIWNIGLRLCW